MFENENDTAAKCWGSVSTQNECVSQQFHLKLTMRCGQPHIEGTRRRLRIEYLNCSCLALDSTWRWPKPRSNICTKNVSFVTAYSHRTRNRQISGRSIRQGAPHAPLTVTRFGTPTNHDPLGASAPTLRRQRRQHCADNRGSM